MLDKVYSSSTSSLYQPKNIDDFIHSVSSTSKRTVLIYLENIGELSAYELQKPLEMSYKNVHKILQELKELGIIEMSGQREPPRFAIKYKLTVKGKKVIEFMNLIGRSNLTELD